MQRTNPEKHKTLERIAREVLNLPTLATRRSDSLDFREQAVWQIAEALAAAYEAGRAAALPPPKTTPNPTTRTKP